MSMFSPVQVGMFKRSEHSTLESIALQNLGFRVSKVSHQVVPEIPLHAIQAEAIRAALWMHSNEGTQPVHINRFLRAAQRLMKPIWRSRNRKDTDVSTVLDDVGIKQDEAFLEEKLYRLHSDALNELAVIGDIAELPKGYWLPAPLRVVELPATQRWLLVGGLPTHRFDREHMQPLIEFSGFARFLTHHPQSVGLGYPTQSYKEWCRLPEEPLREWTKRLFDDVELTPYVPGDWQPKIYVPHPQRNLQYDRWTKNIYGLADGRYLLRITSRFVSVYRIAEIRSHQIKLVSKEISGRDYRRLCYGIDALKGSPVSIEVKYMKQEADFTLRSEVPGPEHKLLTALGQLHLNKDEKYYPRIWRVPTIYVQEIETALRGLGVQLRYDR